MHWFLDPIQHKYADFSGRASREEYWMFILIYIVVYIAVAIVGALLDITFLTAVFTLAIFVPSIAIAARRLHDIGMSGWWQLVGIIPVVGWIIVIILLARKGQIVSNEYGLVPGVGAAATASAVPAADDANETLSEAEPETEMVSEKKD